MSHSRGRFVPLAAILAVLLLTGIGAEDPQPRPTSQPSREGPFEFQFRPDPDDALYYTIENDLRDSGGVPGWLSYTTSVKDRRTVIQRVEKTTTTKAAAAAVPGQVLLSWEVDRYEVREQGMKGEVSFDSLRDLYPPPSLRGLGGIPGSRTLFSFEPRTGQATNFQLVPSPIAGPATSAKLSRTATRVSLSNRMLADLLRDLGPLYMPPRPVSIGDHWSSSYSESLEPFGTVTTSVTCTLRNVRTVEERLVAAIDIAGVISLQKVAPLQPVAPRTPLGPTSSSAPASTPTTQPVVGPVATSAPATQPAATTAPASQPTTTTALATHPPMPAGSAGGGKPRDFALERTVCLGSVEFDLTRGELISLSLNRELDGAAKLEQTKPDANLPSEIRAGTGHALRVRVSRAAPPKPVIVGGPKPPALSPDEEAKLKPPAPATRPAVTTRPSAHAARTPIARPATQPRSATTRPTRLPPPVSRTERTRPTTMESRLSPPAPGGVRKSATTAPAATSRPPATSQPANDDSRP